MINFLVASEKTLFMVEMGMTNFLVVLGMILLREEVIETF